MKTSFFLVALFTAFQFFSATCPAQEKAQYDPWRRPVSVPDAVYPEEAKATGLGGKIIVIVDVDTTGSVTSIRNLTGPDYVCDQVQRPDVVALRKAASAAALAAKFAPATKNGTAVNLMGRIEIQIAGAGPATGAADGQASSYKEAETTPIGGSAKTPLGDKAYTRTEPNKYTIIGTSIDGGSSASGEQHTIPKDPKALAGGVLNGKAISLPKPTYPAAARALRAGGIVTVQVLVDKDGTVFAAGAMGGHPFLQRSSEIAACSAKFNPTMHDGRPVT
ncbi:MAG TPA: energy transducer TonB, partial [Pyrinomonadaceae bacterium]|nr:energy transducer TonB [Pyrinomonadaceae bacterium]